MADKKSSIKSNAAMTACDYINETYSTDFVDNVFEQAADLYGNVVASHFENDEDGDDALGYISARLRWYESVPESCKSNPNFESIREYCDEQLSHFSDDCPFYLTTAAMNIINNIFADKKKFKKFSVQDQWKARKMLWEYAEEFITEVKERGIEPCKAE